MTSIIITFKPTGSTVIYDSINAAAEGLGIKPNSVSQWVGGHSKPPAYIKAERLTSLNVRTSADAAVTSDKIAGGLPVGNSNDNYNIGV